MTLNELNTNLTSMAALLGDYQAMSKNDLANGYCDADEEGNEPLRNAYWCAILKRYFHWTWRWKQDSASLNPSDEDLFCWLNDAITDAFNYRSWRPIRHDGYAEKDWVKAGNPYKAFWIENPQFVHDVNAADKSINYFLGAKRGKMYQEANKDKRKANVLTYSIDSMVDENGDCALDYVGAVDDVGTGSGVVDLINRFINEGHTIEAIILDGIVNHDSFKDKKSSHYVYDVDQETGEEIKEKVYDYSSEFDPRKLVKHLNSVNQDFLTYFCHNYEISVDEGKQAIEKLHSLNNSKLYTYIKKTLIQIKETPELLSYLTR